MQHCCDHGELLYAARVVKAEHCPTADHLKILPVECQIPVLPYLARISAVEARPLNQIKYLLWRKRAVFASEAETESIKQSKSITS